MKKIILTLIATGTFLFSYTQAPDFSLKKYDLKGEVTKVSRKDYSYKTLQKSVVVSNESTQEFDKNGILNKYYSEYYTFSGKYITNYTVKKGKVTKSINDTYDVEKDEIKSTSVTDYVYKNGLVHKSKNDPNSKYPYETEYIYNSKNELIKEVKMSNGKLSYETAYTDVNGDSYTKTKKYYDTKTGNLSSTSINKYENGLQKEASYKSKFSEYKTIYFYNSHNDLIKTVKNGKTNYEYDYEYDKYGNWIKKVSISSYLEKRYTYFYFRELKYGRKTTGSTDFDVEFAKKHGNYDSYEVKPYEKSKSLYSTILENPTTIKKMYVMKTEGSKFKVKTGKGNYITGKVKAIKHTNKMDMIIYHPKSNTTALMEDFSDEFTRLDTWMEATIISSTDSIFWSIDDKKNWYITDRGLGYKRYKESKLKYSTTNSNDVILYLNGVATYKMKNYKNAIPHKLYALIKL